jgi:hypothetical protein
MNLVNISIQEDDFAVIKDRADKDGSTLDRAFHSVMNDAIGKKRPNLVERFLTKSENCEHPYSRRIYDAFGVHCDLCKIAL